MCVVVIRTPWYDWGSGRRKVVVRSTVATVGEYLDFVAQAAEYLPIEDSEIRIVKP